MTERELMAYVVAAIREFEAMLDKTGSDPAALGSRWARTPKVRASLVAGFRDGLHSMAGEMRRRGMVQP